MFRTSKENKQSKAKGSCIEASNSARYQSVATTDARTAPTRTFRGNPMVPVSVQKANRKTVQQN